VLQLVTPSVLPAYIRQSALTTVLDQASPFPPATSAIYPAMSSIVHDDFIKRIFDTIVELRCGSRSFSLQAPVITIPLSSSYGIVPNGQPWACSTPPIQAQDTHMTSVTAFACPSHMTSAATSSATISTPAIALASSSVPSLDMLCPFPGCLDVHLLFSVQPTDTVDCDLGSHLSTRHGVVWVKRSSDLPAFVCFWPGCVCRKHRPESCAEISTALGRVNGQSHPAHVRYGAWKHVLSHLHLDHTCECSKKLGSHQSLVNHRTRGWQKHWKKNQPADKAKLTRGKCQACDQSFGCADAMLSHQQSCLFATFNYASSTL
jgi:hypothetical protein